MNFSDYLTYCRFALQLVLALLAVRHLRSDLASPLSKRLVGGLTAFAVLAPLLWPDVLPFGGLVTWIALPLQFAVSFYVALHQIIWSSGAGSTIPLTGERPNSAGGASKP